jgi:hypothetical protein
MPADQLRSMAMSFALNKRNVKVLNEEIKTANFNTKIELVESEALPLDLQVVRRFKAILKTHYNIELKLENDFYALKHRDQFAEFLSKNADIQEFKFKSMKPDVRQFLDQDDSQNPKNKLLLDYNYYDLSLNQALEAIEADFNCE